MLNRVSFSVAIFSLLASVPLVASADEGDWDIRWTAGTALSGTRAKKSGGTASGSAATRERHPRPPKHPKPPKPEHPEMPKPELPEQPQASSEAHGGPALGAAGGARVSLSRATPLTVGKTGKAEGRLVNLQDGVADLKLELGSPTADAKLRFGAQGTITASQGLGIRPGDSSATNGYVMGSLEAFGRLGTGGERPEGTIRAMAEGGFMAISDGVLPLAGGNGVATLGPAIGVQLGEMGGEKTTAALWGARGKYFGPGRSVFGFGFTRSFAGPEYTEVSGSADVQVARSLSVILTGRAAMVSDKDKKAAPEAVVTQAVGGEVAAMLSGTFR